jgi:tetratricopeptide (TPR) repeat protein
VLDRWPPYHAREVALDELRLAMQREPSALDARFYCASFLRDHGRLAEAIALFEEILAIVPDHVETLVALAVVLTRAGRRLDARGALERALAHDAAHLGAPSRSIMPHLHEMNGSPPRIAACAAWPRRPATRSPPRTIAAPDTVSRSAGCRIMANACRQRSSR